jgi:hypothetical protein
MTGIYILPLSLYGTLKYYFIADEEFSLRVNLTFTCTYIRFRLY